YAGSLELLADVRARVPQLAQGIGEGGGAEAAGQVSEFMSRIGERIGTAIAFAESEAPLRLGGLGDAMNANIAAAIEIEKQAISTRIDQARGAAYAGAAGARAHVEAEYAGSMVTIERETLAAIEALDAEHVASLEEIEALQLEGLEDVNAQFAEGRRQHEDK